MKHLYFTFAVVGFFVYTSFAQAEMASTNFLIRWDTISAGGSDTSSSASYLLRDTAESTVAGSESSSASYQLAHGYRAGVDDQIITFEVFSQNTGSGRAATALVGTTVTTSTAGLTVGNLIAVVQNVGSSQVSAIGRIASIGVGTVTVDAWKDGGVAPVVDGTNDSVYPLTSTTASLGNLSATAISTAIVGFEVSAANDNGYVVQLMDNGNLVSGANDINDVVDGAVTVGSEEYGAKSSDTTIATSTFDTVDSPITTTFQDVATESTPRFEDRNFITLKAAISSSSAEGSYTQTISLIASGNF